MRVKLFTQDGGFVHDTEIPPFGVAPPVIYWGIRVFVLDAENPQLTVSGQVSHYNYTEAWAYAIAQE